MFSSTERKEYGNKVLTIYTLNEDCKFVYDQCIDKHDEKFLNDLDLTKYYPIEEVVVPSQTSSTSSTPSTSSLEESVDVHSIDMPDIPQVQKIHLKLDNAVRTKTLFKGCTAFSPIGDLKISIDIDPLSLYKWEKLASHIAGPIFPVSSMNSEFDLPNETAKEIFEEWLGTLENAILRKISSGSKGETSEEQVQNERIQNILCRLFSVCSGQFGRLMPIIKSLNKVFMLTAGYTQKNKIVKTLTEYKKIIVKNDKKRSIENYVALFPILWDFYHECLPVSILSTVVFAVVQSLLFLFASKIYIEHPSDLRIAPNEEPIKWNVFDTVANLILTRLQVYLSLPNEESWVRIISFIVCGRDNADISLEKTKEICHATIFKHLKEEFKLINITHKRQLTNGALSKNTMLYEKMLNLPDQWTDKKSIEFYNVIQNYCEKNVREYALNKPKFPKLLEEVFRENNEIMAFLIHPRIFMLDFEPREFIQCYYASILKLLYSQLKNRTLDKKQSGQNDKADDDVSENVSVDKTLEKDLRSEVSSSPSLQEEVQKEEEKETLDNYRNRQNTNNSKDFIDFVSKFIDDIRNQTLPNRESVEIFVTNIQKLLILIIGERAEQGETNTANEQKTDSNNLFDVVSANLSKINLHHENDDISSTESVLNDTAMSIVMDQILNKFEKVAPIATSISMGKRKTIRRVMAKKKRN